MRCWPRELRGKDFGVRGIGSRCRPVGIEEQRDKGYEASNRFGSWRGSQCSEVLGEGVVRSAGSIRAMDHVVGNLEEVLAMLRRAAGAEMWRDAADEWRWFAMG